MTQTVYESIYVESQPDWSKLSLRALYDSKRSYERDLVGFIGEESTCQFLTIVMEIPCINLKPFGCQPFQPKLSGVEYEATFFYHRLLIKDLEEWAQETLAKLQSLTNDMSMLTLNEH